MNIELLTVFLLTLIPIIISPGPANILYAASGSSYGIKRTIPFWIATNITSLFQTLLVGFGLSFLMKSNAYLMSIINYAGVLFLIYLAFKFFKMSVDMQDDIKPLSFKDGVIIEALNAKYLLVPSIMFSQFYNPSDGYFYIFVLAFSLLGITLLTSMLWIIGGNTLASFVSNEKIQRHQGQFFGTLLLITAIWLAFG